jgi:hypothetical protein
MVSRYAPTWTVRSSRSYRIDDGERHVLYGADPPVWKCKELLDTNVYDGDVAPSTENQWFARVRRPRNNGLVTVTPKYAKPFSCPMYTTAFDMRLNYPCQGG